MWKLPLYRAKDSDDVFEEIDACAEEHPMAWVKLNGYDPVREGQVLSFLVRTPQRAGS